MPISSQRPELAQFLPSELVKLETLPAPYFQYAYSGACKYTPSSKYLVLSTVTAPLFAELLINPPTVGSYSASGTVRSFTVSSVVRFICKYEEPSIVILNISSVTSIIMESSSSKLFANL